MRKIWVLGLIALFMSGCNVDTDGDGLSNRGERQFGTDPQVVDTDGDGLDDYQEWGIGTDGTNPDTDGDGYTDWEEIEGGSDPVDDDSVIYRGGWPFNHPLNKSELEGNAYIGPEQPQPGDRMPRFYLMDQYGEEVDLYDFANHGVPIVYDLSLEWCGPCRSMARWLSGEDNRSYEEFNDVRDRLNLDYYWFTTLVQASDRTPANFETLQRWHEEFPAPVPVLDDSDRNISSWVQYNAYPIVGVLNENMEVIILNDRMEVLRYLQGELR